MPPTWRWWRIGATCRRDWRRHLGWMRDAGFEAACLHLHANRALIAGRKPVGRELRGAMGKVYEQLDDALAGFIGRQHVFFVGTAPDSPEGHLNVSPKGLDTFRILGPKSVAYLDLTGSGIETVAHLRENGRITIMFCAFEGRPLIVRLTAGGGSSSRATPSGTA